MKKILKYGITCLLIFAICSVTCFAEQDKVSSDNERKIVYQDSTIIIRQNSDGSITECEYLQTGIKEVTYSEGDTIVDRFYDDNGVMISEKIYERSDFISEEITLPNESKEIIDTTLFDLNQKYEKITPEMIKTKLLEKGILCEVSVVSNALVIDPLINKTKVDAISDFGSDGDIDLPMLSIMNSPLLGYEAYEAYDISELVSANPWNEDMELSELPVFRNRLTYDEEKFIALDGDIDKMKALIIDVAGRLGLDIDHLTIEEKFHRASDRTAHPTEVKIKVDGLTITVGQSLLTSAWFDPAISLPETCHFTFDASYTDMLSAAEYFISAYKDFIGMKDPQININGGNYTYDGQQIYNLSFFDASEDEVEQLINYNFNQVSFCCNDEGKLFIARISQPDLSEKVGEYPIITPEQAKEMFLNGNYITNVSDSVSEADLIKKVELVYRSGEWEEYFMPYYRIYAEIPEKAREDGNGLKHYAVYYVPAVESSYISNMPKS